MVYLRIIFNKNRNILIKPLVPPFFLVNKNIKFEQIWVLHPDPWPKAKHEKRRLLQTEFIKTLASHLTTNGEIIIGTDHWGYFDWIIERINESGLQYTTPDLEIIKTRYQAKNMAETGAPKYIIIKNK